MWTDRRRRRRIWFGGEVPLKHEEQRKETLSIDAEQINHLFAEQQEKLGYLMQIPRSFHRKD